MKFLRRLGIAIYPLPPPQANTAMKFPLPASPPIPLLLPLLLSLIPVPSAGPPPPPSPLTLCQTVKSCGNITNITYPFCFHDDSAPPPSLYCGYSGFELTCRNNTPTLRLPTANYTVTAINYYTHTISVADADFLRDSPLDVCPRDLQNLTLDHNSTLGYAPSDANLTFFFECTGGNLSQHEIQCPGSANRRSSYVLNSDAMTMNQSALPRDCHSVVVAPVLRVAVAAYCSGDLGAHYKEVLKSGFQLSWPSVSSGDCGACENSDGRCGLNRTSNSTWKFACFCSDGIRAAPRCGGGRAAHKKKKEIVIGTLSIAGFLVLLCTSLTLYRLKKKKFFSTSSKSLIQNASFKPSTKDRELGSALIQTHLFSYDELREATNCFSASNELGDGGFATVYKGKLQDGRTIAVKRLYENNCRRLEQFMNEIEILSRLRHPNLVSLYGCTSPRSQSLLLVYEFVPNGTVADHLHGSRTNEGILNWPMRLNIAIETADALAYLHSVQPPIIHRDVKTCNILLDSNFHVKVADFGLSRLVPMDATHISTAPQGTPGYLDPEYHQCYQLTDKSDVYSFGVVLVELISSKPAVDMSRNRSDMNLANVAITRIQNDEIEQLVDASLGYQSDQTIRKMMTIVAEVAFRCLQPDGDLRPPMKEVLEVLRSIENEGHKVEKEQGADAGIQDDFEMLKNTTPLSPDSVMNTWASKNTTPNTSE